MADITKIQPMGDTEQYTLGARYLTHTPNNTTTFLRGDNTFTNTISNILYIQRETTDANILTDNGSAKLQFNVKATEQSNTQGYSYIAAYQTPTATTYNDSLVIVSTGACLIGGGEGAETIHRAVLTSGSGTENLYLCPDGDIHYYTGADSKTLRAVFNSSSQFYPATNNSGAIGTSSYKWANMYATTFHGALDGNAATATALTSSAGSSTVPIYFSSGKPVQCSTTLGVSITGNAATATKITYPAQLTTDDAINAFNEGNKFQVATWNSTSSPGVSNGILISAGWTGTSYGAQIAIDDDPTWYIALRQRNGDGWKAWKRIPMGDGTGASGTWGISITGSSASCTGNAATATKVGNSSCWGYFHNNNELNFGGTGAGTNIYIGYRAMDSKPIPTNVIFGGSSGSSNIKCNNVMSNATVSSTHSTYGACISMWSDSEGGNIFWRCAGSGGSASNTGYQIDTCSNVLRLYRTTNGGAAATHGATLMDSNGYASFPRVYGAVWNDYAEFRQTKDKIEPGRCIKEIGDDTLELTSERLQAGCEIVSDTYGFGIGETEKCKTPTAASGRVLAYPYEDRELLRQHIGEPVCSGPNGTVSLMTHEEAKKYPWLIIGTISAIPDYKEWEAGYKGDHIVKVNGRIWIRIR